MNKPLLSLAIATGLLGSTAANALYSFDSTQTIVFGTAFDATHNYTGNQSTQFTSTPQTLSFAQFDTLDGRRTLTDVIITWTPTLTSTYTFNNGSGNARDLSLSFNTTASLISSPYFNIPTSFTNDAIDVIIPQQSQGALTPVAINNTGSLTTIDPADINPFIGTGTISVTNTFTNLTSLLISNRGGFGNLSGTSSGQMGGTLKVQYFWLDPIPEPATWGMLILGFGMVGASMRRRRERSAAA